MAELSTLSAVIKAALSGATRLDLAVIDGAGTAAARNVGTAEGSVPVLDEDGKLDAAVIPDDLGGGEVDPEVIAALEPRPTLADWATAARDLAAADDRALLRVTHATPVLTIRTQASVAYPAGMYVSGTAVHGLTIAPAAGVTINGGTEQVRIGPEGAGGSFAIIRRATNEWVVAGAQSAMPEWLAAVFGEASGDAEHGPELGVAVLDAMISMAAAALLAKLGALHEKSGHVGIVLDPEVAAADGDLALFGPSPVSGLRSLVPVGASAMELRPNTFFHGAAGTGAAEQLSYAESWARLETARPYAAQPATLIANVVNFSVAEGAKRQIKAPVLTADSTLSVAPWDGIVSGMDAWQLRVETGATGYKFGAATPTDGIEHVGYDRAVALAANSYHYFELFRFDNKPVLRFVASTLISAGEAPDPVFIGHVVTRNNPTSVKVPPHEAGDLEIYLLTTPSGTLPSIPGSLTAITLDTDAVGPSNRLAFRIAPTTETGETTLAGFSGCSAAHCVIVRQATGTPQVHGTVIFANTTYATTSIPCAALNAGANAIYFVAMSGQSTDDLTLPAGVTPLPTASDGGGADTNNECALGYTSVLPPPGWAGANGAKAGVIGRCNAMVFAVKAG